MLLSAVSYARDDSGGGRLPGAAIRLSTLDQNVHSGFFAGLLRESSSRGW